MSRALSDDIVNFVQTQLGSLWALELMLKMAAAPDRDWTVPALVQELRASERAIAANLERFQRSQLIREGTPGTWRWQPVDTMHDVCRQLIAAYGITPFAVIQAIAEAPEQRLRQFADAFRLRKDNE